MARKKETEQDIVRRTGPREIRGLVWVFLSVLFLVSLLSYRPMDLPILQDPPNEPTANLIGHAGAWTGFIAFSFLGLSAYMLPGVLALHGLFCLLGDDHLPRARLRPKLIWMTVLLLCSACLLVLLQPLLVRPMESLELQFAGGIFGGEGQ